MTENELDTHAMKLEAYKIMRRLKERDLNVRMRIYHIIKRCGLEFAQEILAETKKVQANGGLMTQDGSRRRTRGGVYFHLVRSRLSPEDERAIFRYKPKKRVKQQPQSDLAQAEATLTSTPTAQKDQGLNGTDVKPSLEAQSTHEQRAAEQPTPRPAKQKSKARAKQQPRPKLSSLQAAKLQQLETAAETLRQRIAGMKQKKQSSAILDRMLANTEKQIAEIYETVATEK